MAEPLPNYLQSVRDQYEDYPYPKRNPEEEKTRLMDPFLDPLAMINYYCFEGKQDFAQNFRVLIAGGGTGDALIYLAEQLRDSNAEIVYVDISTASMAIAKERAAIRRLTNITWIHGSLLEVANLGIGMFDYINCSGVLHHLHSPAAGLQALNSVLKDDGAMGIVVYATYGRTGVYHLQALMRILCQHASSPQEKVEICKAVLKQMPVTNWFVQAPEPFLNDMQSDIGIYDLFLHSQDRAYTVPELYQWVEECGLHLLDLTSWEGNGKTLYHPATHLPDKHLVNKTAHYLLPQQQAIAEIAAGITFLHHCYLAKSLKPKPQPTDLDMIPMLGVFSDRSPAMYQKLYEVARTQQPKKQQGKYYLNRRALDVIITANRYTLPLFQAINGKRTVGEIIDYTIAATAKTDTPAIRAEMLRQFSQLYTELAIHDWFILRHKTIPEFKMTAELQAPVTAHYSKLPLG
jgi:SAM-dependent methyltransferase